MKITEQLITDLSNSITNDIMKAGEDKRGFPRRIQFKGGDWRDKEFDMGGLCHTALESLIFTSLRNKLLTP